MAETDNKNQRQETQDVNSPKLSVDDDVRLRYIGFDVGSKKIGELFRSGKEQESFLTHVREKRERNDILRDTSNFREERISATERYILLAVSLFVLVSTFLPVTPWISGYFETRTEVAITASKPAGDAALGNDSTAALLGGATEEGSPAVEGASAPVERTGFQDLQVKKTRTRIEKTPFKLSGAQLFARFGDFSSDVFSSGIALKITGILFLFFVLLIYGVPSYIIYSILTIKGDPDAAALKLKKALRVGWFPVILWALMLVLSVAGADYGFDTTGALKQVGDGYGMSSFLGLLGSGFYISLGGCMFAGVKSVEI